MPAAPAGVGDSEPRQLPERKREGVREGGRGESKKEYIQLRKTKSETNDGKDRVRGSQHTAVDNSVQFC